MTTGEVMDMVAALMNDTIKSSYTYGAVLPYLNMALGELQELFELNNIPVTNKTSAVVATTAGVITIGFATTPALPSDLIEIEQLWESPAGQNKWTQMTKKNFLPHYLEGNVISQFLVWAWEEQAIKLLPTNSSIDLKLDYIKSLFTLFTDVTGADTISILNSKTFLGFRTAGLCSEFIGENKTRADALNNQSELALQRSLGISTKGKQGIITRRKPFMAAYRSRGVY